MHRSIRLLVAGSLFGIAASSWAQTSVEKPWVRGTVPNQMSTGAFMQIKSAQGGKLVSVQSPVAGIAEIHEMAMDGNVMKMRAVPALDLPAGKTVELKPGGYHLMLMDLKGPVQAGQNVALTLVIEGKDGKRETLQVKAPVKSLGSSDAHEHKH